MMKQIKRAAFVLVVVMGLMAVAPSWVPLFGIETVQAAVKLSQTKATVYEGAVLSLKITGTGEKVTWSSNKKSVATVDAKGKVTAIKPGKAVITAKVGKKSYACKITVPTPDINQDEAEMEVGEAVTLEIEKSNKPVKWKSSDAKVASVDKYGVVIAKKAGKATITGTANGKSYKCKVMVEDTYDYDDDDDDDERFYVERLSLDQTSLELTVGDTYTLTATIWPGHSADQTVSWSSSNTRVASVDSYGVVTAKGAGTAVITAQAGAKSDKCQLTVSKRPESTTDRRNDFIKMIRAKGKYDYDTDCYRLSRTYEGYVYGISYDEDVDMVSFTLLDMEEDMIISIADRGIILVEALRDVVEYEATAYIDPKTFSDNSTVTFTKTSGSATSGAVQAFSNLYLQIGFTLWEDMMETYGYTLADLGFSNFH